LFAAIDAELNKEDVVVVTYHFRFRFIDQHTRRNVVDRSPDATRTIKTDLSSHKCTIQPSTVSPDCALRRTVAPNCYFGFAFLSHLSVRQRTPQNLLLTYSSYFRNVTA
jgi:hypothetical protein